MKVAFLAYDLSEGSGWGRVTVQVVKRLARMGIEPVLFTAHGSSANPLFRGIAHYPVLRSYDDGRAKPLLIARDYLAAAPKIRGCQAVHVLVERYLPLGWLLSGHRPCFLTAHGTYSVEPLKDRWRAVYRRAYRGCETVLCVSRYTAGRLSAAYPAIAPRVRTVGLGVEIDLGRAIPPASTREPAFLTVGEVKPRKGLLEAVRAFGEVVKERPDAKFYVVGRARPGPYVESVKAEAARLGVEDKVIWKGRVPQEELDDLYGRVRGFVLPSLNVGNHFEGFGLVHLEANALGLPTIGSRGCGNEDAIRDGESGFLVEQGDAPSLARSMRALLDPAFDWDGLSRRARAHASAMSWERTAEGWLEAYRAASS